MARHRENLLRLIPLPGGSWLLDGFHLGKRIRKQGRDVNALRVKMQEMQATLERLEIVGTSGAGLVKVTVNGKNETRRVEIDPSLFVPADQGVVEDLIVAAANDARSKVEQVVQEQMKSITGGLPLPPGFKL